MTTSRLSRRLFLSTTAATGLHVATTGLAATLGGCDAGTTGERVSYETLAQSDVVAGETFETGRGWAVTLARAWVCLGYLRYAEGSPVAAHRSPRGWRRSVQGLLLPEAHAHPGHYDEGLTLGEMRQPQLVELLGPAQSLGIEPGVTGDARSALLRFHSDDSVSAPRPEAVAYVEGLARRDGEERLFIAVAARQEVLHSVTDEPEVIGCTLDDGPMETDGRIHLEVQLRLWLDQIDFDLVPEASEPQELTVGEPPHNAFLRGLQKTAAYRFRYEGQ